MYEKHKKFGEGGWKCNGKQVKNQTATRTHKSWETNYDEISTICHKLRQQGTKSQPVRTANVQ